MKTNLPVTQKEVMLKDDEFIVSKTDLKGQITFINKTFIDISGFTEAELIGQPHNIVRHPDMPVEAFADMWKALKEGRPWTGMVKNRCKNGDHYWVVANATPIFHNGQPVGYMSVRSKPSHEQVQAAENAYRKFRDKQATGLAIRDGQVVPTRFSIARWLKNRTISQRVYAISGFLIASMLVVGIAGVAAFKDSQDHVHELFADRVVPLEQLKVIADAYAVDIVDNAHKVRDGALAFDQATQNVEKAQATIAQTWKAYNATYLTTEEQQLVTQAAELMKVADQAAEKLKVILRSQDNTALTSFAANELYPAIDPISDKISELTQLQIRVARELLTEIESHGTAFLWQFSIMLVIATVFGLLFAKLLQNAIRRPLNEIAMFFRLVSEGRIDVQLDANRRDEISAVTDAARSMQIKSGFDINDARTQADEMTRIKISLDNVSTGVMIADTSRTIIYANHSIKRILKNAEADIRQVLPHFSADRLVGENIDQFHKDPSHQARLLSSINGEHRAALQLGARHLVVTASPVLNERGERLGAVAEWQDRTTEVNVEQEVASLVSAAAAGDFTKRLDLHEKEGFFLNLSVGLNQLVETADKGLQDVVRMLGALAQGDLTQRITDEYQGTFGQLKDFSNETAISLSRMLGQIREGADTIYTAANEISVGNTDLSSRTEEQASSLEETASSMEELTSTVKLNADNARQANSLAMNASEVASDGGQLVERVVHTMSSINESSRKISDIIGVIDGIAFQTNILALNAAVEAARAGEQGRGFAVVAAEVRNLAQRSAAAAKEIKTLISDSVDKVETGNTLVAQAGKTMSEIVTAIKRVTDIMAEIAAASAEQSTGIEEVNGAVSQMDEMTQQNAALVEEAAAAAESLLDQAAAMTEAVGIFKFEHASQRPALAAPAARPASLPSRNEPPQRNERVQRQALPRASSHDDEWEQF